MKSEKNKNTINGVYIEDISIDKIDNINAIELPNLRAILELHY